MVSWSSTTEKNGGPLLMGCASSNPLMEGGKNLIDNAKDSAADMVNKGEQVLHDVGDGITSGMESVKGALETAMHSAESGMETMAEKISDAVHSTKTEAKEAEDLMRAQAEEVSKKADAMAVEAVSEAETVMASEIDNVEEEMMKGENMTKEAARNTMEDFQSTFGESVETVKGNVDLLEIEDLENGMAMMDEAGGMMGDEGKVEDPPGAEAREMEAKAEEPGPTLWEIAADAILEKKSLVPIPSQETDFISLVLRAAKEKPPGDAEKKEVEQIDESDYERKVKEETQKLLAETRREMEEALRCAEGTSTINDDDEDGNLQINENETDENLKEIGENELEKQVEMGDVEIKRVEEVKDDVETERIGEIEKDELKLYEVKEIDAIETFKNNGKSKIGETQNQIQIIINESDSSVETNNGGLNGNLHETRDKSYDKDVNEDENSNEERMKITESQGISHQEINYLKPHIQEYQKLKTINEHEDNLGENEEILENTIISVKEDNEDEHENVFTLPTINIETASIKSCESDKV